MKPLTRKMIQIQVAPGATSTTTGNTWSYHDQWTKCTISFGSRSEVFEIQDKVGGRGSSGSPTRSYLCEISPMWGDLQEFLIKNIPFFPKESFSLTVDPVTVMTDRQLARF